MTSNRKIGAIDFLPCHPERKREWSERGRHDIDGRAERPSSRERMSQTSHKLRLLL